MQYCLKLGCAPSLSGIGSVSGKDGVHPGRRWRTSFLRRLPMWRCGRMEVANVLDINKKKNPYNNACAGRGCYKDFVEVPGGFEPPCTVLQTAD